MNMHIHVDSMKAAEKLSGICREFGNDIFLRSDKFHIDPRSTLGILAMMYSSRDHMFLDTGSMDDQIIPRFLDAIDGYIVKEDMRDAV